MASNKKRRLANYLPQSLIVIGVVLITFAVIVMQVSLPDGIGPAANRVFTTAMNAVVPGQQAPYVENQRYTPLEPDRILDTRDGTGICAPSPCTRLAPGGQVEVQITGQGGVPASGVLAVVMNATIDRPERAGFLTIFPKGQPRPVVSNLNFIPGEVRANLSSVKVGVDGRVLAYNGSSHFLEVIFDVSGWYSDGSVPVAGGSFQALTPERLLDTRDGTGQAAAGAIPANSAITLEVEGAGNVPSSGVGAAVLNVTVDEPQAPGFLTVYPDDPRPLASNVNFVTSQIIPNLTAIKLSGDGEVKIFNGSPGTVHVVADVYGIYSDATETFAGGDHEALDAERILDTRDGTGTCTPSPCAVIPADGTIAVKVIDVAGIPDSDVQAVVLNVTVDQPTASGFLTVFPASATRPLASNLNFTPGRPVPNLVKVKVSSAGEVKVYNGSSGTVHVIFDAWGWFSPVV